MIDERTLQQVVDRVVAEAQPSRVILFGSYGRGDARKGSDLDLMVVLPTVTDRYGDMIRLHKAVGNVGVGVDLLVYSDAEFERRSRVPGTVLYSARKEGRQLNVDFVVAEVRGWAEAQVTSAADDSAEAANEEPSLMDSATG